MGAVFVDMQFGGDTVLTECEIKQHAVLRGNARVGVGVKEEAGRGLFRDGTFGGEVFDELGIGGVAQQISTAAFVNVGFLGKGDDGVGENGEIGAGADTFDDIVAGGVAGIEVGGGGGGEVAAGAEAHDADFGGVHFEFGGAGADGAEGALDVVDHGGVAVLGTETVTEDEGGDALRVEPLGDLLALVIVGEGAVAAARADDDCLAVRIFGDPRSERGNIFIVGPLGAGGALGPEGEGGRVGNRTLREERRGGRQKKKGRTHAGNDSAGPTPGARRFTMQLYAYSGND